MPNGSNSEPAGWSRAEQIALTALTEIATMGYAGAPDIAMRRIARDAFEAVMALAPPSSVDGVAPVLPSWEDRIEQARRAIYDADGRGMIGRGRNHLEERVARALGQAALAAAPLPVGNRGVMADRCDGTDTAATTSPSSAGSVAGQGEH